MSDTPHECAKRLIKRAYKMTEIEDEPSASEWLDLVVSLAEELEEYVHRMEGLEK